MTVYPKCGVVRIVSHPHIAYEGADPEYELVARMNGRLVGNMNLAVYPLEDGQPILAVEYAKTLRPRCGIGTKLYKRALQLACKHGIPLASDTSRTEASEGFWAKQATKGRAHCYLSDVPAERLKYSSKEGFYPSGTWPCYNAAT